MKIWKVAALFFAALLFVVLGTSTVRLVSAEPQPHMQAALASLRTAKDQLQKATHDKGGHRVKAIALIDQAIAEVERGIAFDNATPDVPKKGRGKKR